MSTEDHVTRNAFVCAARCGDVSVIESYFAQPHVREEVAEIESLLAASDITASLPRSVGGSTVYPWYYQYLHAVPWSNRVLVFELAVVQRHVHVIKWFFSPPRFAYMRETLLRVLPTVASSAARTNNCEILDWLLSADVSGVLLSDFFHQKLLNGMLRFAKGSVDTIQLLLAHGANLNEHGAHPFENHVLTAWAGLSDLTNMEIAVAEGAFLVGAELLYRPIAMGNTAMARELLKYGVNAKDPRRSPLHEVISRRCGESVRLLVDEAFADVDQCWEQREGGNTPLTAVCDLVAVDTLLGKVDDTPRILAQVLLEAGADTMRRDPQGRNAVEYALERACGSDVAKLLMGHSAST